MESSIRHALESKEIHEQLHDNLDSFSDFSQDSVIDIFDRTDPDSEISRPDLSDSCSNSDDGQVSANVGSDDGGNDGGYDDDDDDDDNEEWALWYESNHDFYMIPFWAFFNCKAP
jgi:hypothetical protein